MRGASWLPPPRSGSGKTTVALALLAALHRRGVAVRAAKSGPDYIDPAFHQAVTGHPSPNLDSWAMPPPLLDATLRDAADGAFLVIEASMGLFDGAGDQAGRTGSSADIAARFGLPVLLVLDVSGQSQSAAAVARGFATHDPAVRVGGVVLNRVGSERHRAGAAGAMAMAGIRLLGALPRDAAISLPERHLGLVQARELGSLPTLLERLADLAEERLDLDGILAMGAAPRIAPGMAGQAALAPPGQRIALANDDAFAFIYPHVLAGWRRAGAEIVAFSPLADQAPPEDCDACWLPGGYPELHAGRLAAAQRFMRGMRRFAACHPVHGECGGYMALGAGLVDAAGERHAMLGLLGHTTSFAKRRMNLGYRQATLLADTALGPAGTVLRGHEFHYASTVDPGADGPLATLRDARGEALGQAGGRRGQVDRQLLPRHRPRGDTVTPFPTLDALRAACADLPQGDEAAGAAVQARQAQLTKPPGSLGRLETLVAWLARWQGRAAPRLDRVQVLIFAGNHGVTARGVSPFPPAVTAQMVANFAAGGAAINQLARAAGAALRVIPVALDRPTGDLSQEPAMPPDEFLEAVAAGFGAVQGGTDLLCLGEMGIGNTTAAAALAAALFGGDGLRWAGRGTGVDDAGLARKRQAVDAALARHAGVLADPLAAAAALGGRELAAILGATLAARHHGVPVLLDGFACTAAVAPLARLAPGALDHAVIAHMSAESGHRALAAALGMTPLLDLGMRLGEASGATLAVPLLRAALACHTGMASQRGGGGEWRLIPGLPPPSRGRAGERVLHARYTVRAWRTLSFPRRFAARAPSSP